MKKWETIEGDNNKGSTVVEKFHEHKNGQPDQTRFCDSPLFTYLAYHQMGLQLREHAEMTNNRS